MWQGLNNRKFPRGNYKCVVTLRQEGQASVANAVTENIGLGGVCVLMDKGLDIFSPIELDLSLEDGKPAIQVHGTIVWVVRRTGTKKGPSFDTGIEFTELKPEDKARIEAILDKVAGKS